MNSDAEVVIGAALAGWNMEPNFGTAGAACMGRVPDPRPLKGEEVEAGRAENRLAGL